MRTSTAAPPLPAMVALAPMHRMRGGAAALAHPPNQHSDAVSLATAVGVQFIQHQKLQTPARFYQLRFVGPGQDQLQHDKVGEQQVGRVGDDRLDALALRRAKAV